MIKANRIQDKASSAGFDWEEPQQVYQKVKEELSELEAEIQERDQARIEAEFGDVLFSLINYARFIKVDPESALERTNKKFIDRFQYLENAVKKAGKKLSDLKLEEMDVYWEEAKRR